MTVSAENNMMNGIRAGLELNKIGDLIDKVTHFVIYYIL